jgi:hypothetical protein
MWKGEVAFDLWSMDGSTIVIGTVGKDDLWTKIFWEKSEDDTHISEPVVGQS